MSAPPYPSTQALNSALDRIRSFAYRGRADAPPRKSIVIPTQQYPVPTAYHMDASGMTQGDASAIMNGSFPPTSGRPATPTQPKSALKGSSSTDGGFGSSPRGSGGGSDSLNSRELFLYITASLRERYGDPAPKTPLSELTDEDLAALADAFHRELRKVAGRTNVVVQDPRSTSTPPPAPAARTNANTPPASPGRASVAVASSSSSTQGASTVVPVPRSLKEAMTLLRDGCFVTKFSSSKGLPSRRYVSVQNRRALIDGEMLSVPHFCWASSQNEEPSGALSLLDMSNVINGPSPAMKKAVSTTGQIVGAQKETIDDRQCLTVQFGDRSIDFALPTLAHARAWERAVTYVIDRNKRL